MKTYLRFLEPSKIYCFNRLYFRNRFLLFVQNRYLLLDRYGLRIYKEDFFSGYLTGTPQEFYRASFSLKNRACKISDTCISQINNLSWLVVLYGIVTKWKKEAGNFDCLYTPAGVYNHHNLLSGMVRLYTVNHWHRIEEIHPRSLPRTSFSVATAIASTAHDCR